MRLSTLPRLCPLAAAALALAPASAGAAAHTMSHATPHAVPRAPGVPCAADGRAFPLTTRIHGGPASYEAGGGPGTWFLDLRNVTERACEDVHPVVVLVDREHALRAAQPRLEFYAGGRPHPVRFVATDRDELVGAFDAGGPGLTIGPRRTRTVKVRLSLAPDAVANEVAATAAVVQRRDDDGDWIGQSNTYRFRVTDAGPGTGRARPDGTAPDPEPRPEPEADPDTGTGDGTGDGTDGTDPPGRSPEDESLADQLARTGVHRARTTLAVAALLVALGCTLVHVRRRL